MSNEQESGTNDRVLQAIRVTNVQKPQAAGVFHRQGCTRRLGGDQEEYAKLHPSGILQGIRLIELLICFFPCHLQLIWAAPPSNKLTLPMPEVGRHYLSLGGVGTDWCRGPKSGQKWPFRLGGVFGARVPWPSARHY